MVSPCASPQLADRPWIEARSRTLDRSICEEHPDFTKDRSWKRTKRLLRSGDRTSQTEVHFEDDLQDARSGSRLFAAAPDDVRRGRTGPFQTGRDRRRRCSAQYAVDRTFARKREFHLADASSGADRSVRAAWPRKIVEDGLHEIAMPAVLWRQAIGVETKHVSGLGRGLRPG